MRERISAGASNPHIYIHIYIYVWSEGSATEKLKATHIHIWKQCICNTYTRLKTIHMQYTWSYAKNTYTLHMHIWRQYICVCIYIWHLLEWGISNRESEGLIKYRINSLYYLYVRHDSLICVTWLIATCDMTHFLSDYELSVTWLIAVCDMTHCYVWHDSLLCVTWLIAVCDMINCYVSHVSFSLTSDYCVSEWSGLLYWSLFIYAGFFPHTSGTTKKIS